MQNFRHALTDRRLGVARRHKLVCVILRPGRIGPTLRTTPTEPVVAIKSNENEWQIRSVESARLYD